MRDGRLYTGRLSGNQQERPMKKVAVVETRAVTFGERLEELKAVNAERHYDAALSARLEFEERLVQTVRRRALEVLDAVTEG
jgi:hypothetical protein